MSQSKEGRIVVVVAGMHRCGTSVVTRGLLASGLYLGGKLLPETEEDNPRGYWEDSSVVTINSSIMALFGSNELSPHWFTEDELRKAIPESYYTLARNLVSERLSHKGLWAFKDPRTALLLPFWQKIFNDLEVDDRYVIALRNPLDSAASFCHRNNKDKRNHKVSLSWGSVLWAEHMLSAAYGVQHRKAVVVDYDLLMHDAKSQIRRITNILEIPRTQESVQDIDDYATLFVDSALRHFSSDLDNLASSQDIIPIIKDMYSVLRGHALQERAFSYNDNAVFWNQVYSAFSLLAPAFDGFTAGLANVRPHWRTRLRMSVLSFLAK